MTSQIPKISRDCRKIKLQNFSILRYYSSICATHARLPCNKLFETAFYSLSVRTYSCSRSSVVIDLGANRKRICTFRLVTYSNFGRISYHFRDIDTFSSKLACFSYPSLVLRPLAAERHEIST